MPDTDPIIVFITAADRAEATRLAEMLVESRLAACVQLLPEIKSIYLWKGNVERQAEVLLVGKTVKSNFAELEREVRALHSYETPEIVAVPMAACSAPYLEWLISATKVTAGPGAPE